MIEQIFVKQNEVLVGPFANTISAKYEVIANGGFIVYQVAKVQ